VFCLFAASIVLAPGEQQCYKITLFDAGGSPSSPQKCDGDQKRKLVLFDHVPNLGDIVECRDDFFFKWSLRRSQRVIYLWLLRLSKLVHSFTE